METLKLITSILFLVFTGIIAFSVLKVIFMDKEDCSEYDVKIDTNVNLYLRDENGELMVSKFKPTIMSETKEITEDETNRV
jgi:hypothetical protein